MGAITLCIEFGLMFLGQDMTVIMLHTGYETI